MQSLKQIFFILLFAINAFHIATSQDIIELELRFTEQNDKLKGLVQYDNVLPSEARTEEELENVYKQLHNLGYLEAVKESCQYDSLSVKCIIKPGRKFRYNVSPGNLGEEILAGISNKSYFNEAITPGQYKELAEEILKFFENNGYPFASVSLSNSEIRDTLIKGSLDIDHSNYIVFDTLNVTGNVDINPRFLAQHTGIRPDKSYSEKVVKNLANKLKALDFVTIKEDPRIKFTETHAKVEVELERRGANRFDGVAGVLYDEAADNAMRLTGQVNLYLINTLQRGEWMDLRWQGLGYGTQSLNISGGYPYLFYTPLSAEMEFEMRKQDSTYLHIRRVPALGYRFQSNIRANVFVDWRTSELLEASRYQDAEILPEAIDYKTIFYGLSAEYKSDLFGIEPREGYSYGIKFAAGTRNIRVNNNLPAHLYDDVDLSSTQYTGVAKLQRILPFRDRSAVFLKGAGGVIIGDDVFENELFRVGGLHSLRGFDEESLLASAYGYILTEYRYIAGENTYLSMFVNGGFIERKTSGYFSDIPVGAGAGISQETQAGILSLFFALGKRKDEQVNFNNIKVHVGFVSTF